MTKALSGGQRKYPLFLCFSTIWSRLPFFSFREGGVGNGRECGEEEESTGSLTLILIYKKNNRYSFWFSSSVPRKHVLKQHALHCGFAKAAQKRASCCVNMSDFIAHMHLNDQRSSLFSKVSLQADCWLKTRTQLWWHWVSEYFLCSCRFSVCFAFFHLFRMKPQILKYSLAALGWICCRFSRVQNP